MHRSLAPLGLVAGLVLGLASLAFSGQDEAGTPSSSEGVRIGTFDSRAVAIAYYRSDLFAERLRGFDEEEAVATQAEAHRRSFGNASVKDLLPPVATELETVAREAGVDVLVSEWELVYRAPGLSFVDVTDLLVEAFDPDDATRRVAREIREKDPVPLSDLRDHRDD